MGKYFKPEKLKADGSSGRLSRLSKKLFTNLTPRKLITLSSVILLLLVAALGANLLRQKIKNDQLVKEALRLSDVQQKAELSETSSEVLVSTSEIDKLIATKNFTAAKQKTDELLAKNPNDESTKAAAYGLYQTICLNLRDYACLDNVIGFQKEKANLDVFFLISIADGAKAAGDNTNARKYYQAALAEIDAKGGESYISQINANVQQELNYNAIKQGAQ